MDKTADLTFLRTFTGSDPVKMKKYISLFLAGAEPGLDTIRTALAGSDWRALRTAAHSLKSQVKYMGIKEAEELALQVERIADDQKGLEKLPETIEKLCAVTTRACGELREELNGL